jgi:hypothetical protein
MKGGEQVFVRQLSVATVRRRKAEEGPGTPLSPFPLILFHHTTTTQELQITRASQNTMTLVSPPPFSPCMYTFVYMYVLLQSTKLRLYCTNIPY